MKQLVAYTVCALCLGPTSLYAQQASTSTSAAVKSAKVETSSTVRSPPHNAAPAAPQVAAVVAPRSMLWPPSVPFGPYLRLSGLAVRDRSFGLTAPFGALVRLEGGVEVSPLPEIRGLAFELGMGIGAQGATSLDTVHSRFAVTSFQASVLYRQGLFSYFTAYGRATGGLNVAYLNLAPELFDRGVDKLAVGASVAGTLGMELSIPIRFTPRKSDPQAGDNYLGFFFEAGYEVHSNLQFDGASRDVDVDTEPARIAGSREGLGDLNLTGWLWRLGGSFRF
jgi:hypothetical protein